MEQAGHRRGEHHACARGEGQGTSVFQARRAGASRERTQPGWLGQTPLLPLRSRTLPPAEGLVAKDHAAEAQGVGGLVLPPKLVVHSQEHLGKRGHEVWRRLARQLGLGI